MKRNSGSIGPSRRLARAAAAGLVLGVAGAAGAAHAACAGAGVITRIQGQPQDVSLNRAGAAVSRPRVLELLCEGDVVEVQGATVATLSLDGTGVVKVSAGKPVTIGKRKAAPTVAGNAYASLSDHVLKDMKRQPWDVRLRGPGPPLSFAVASLAQNGQRLTPGRRDLLVRMSGGVGAYKVTLTGPSGSTAAQAQGVGNDVVLSGVTLAAGDYKLLGVDGGGATATATVHVMAAPLPVTADGSVDDLEVRAALQASELARTEPATWSFESEQILNAAPVAGLDREAVYRLIESYSDDGGA